MESRLIKNISENIIMMAAMVGIGSWMPSGLISRYSDVACEHFFENRKLRPEFECHTTSTYVHRIRTKFGLSVDLKPSHWCVLEECDCGVAFRLLSRMQSDGM